jgi:hypothetical protein
MRRKSPTVMRGGRLPVGRYGPGFPVGLLESMSLMRLSVKKAAYADVSRAAYRKSGAPHRYLAVSARLVVCSQPVAQGTRLASTLAAQVKTPANIIYSVKP